MKSKTNSLSDCPPALLALAFALLLAVGCQSTITPRLVQSSAPSWDAGGQNSGFLGWTNYHGETAGIITPHSRDRYNALVALYGAKFAPPLAPDAGICTNCLPGLILISPQAIEHYARMNRWHKSELH